MKTPPRLSQDRPSLAPHAKTNSRRPRPRPWGRRYPGPGPIPATATGRTFASQLVSSSWMPRCRFRPDASLTWSSPRTAQLPDPRLAPGGADADLTGRLAAPGPAATRGTRRAALRPWPASRSRSPGRCTRRSRSASRCRERQDAAQYHAVERPYVDRSSKNRTSASSRSQVGLRGADARAEWVVKRWGQCRADSAFRSS